MLYNAGDVPASTGTVAIEGGVITEVPPLELAATNLLLQSSAFGVTWTTSGAIVIAPNSTIGPRGATDADTLNDNGATTGEVLQDVVIANDAIARTFSVYLLAGTSTQTRVGLRLTGGTALDANVDVNPANGTILVASANVLTSAVEVLSIGGAAWIRVSVAVTNNASGNINAQPYIQPASLSAATQGTVIAWGAQLETGSHLSTTAPAPTTQIPTTTAQVTRLAGLIPGYLVDGSSFGLSGSSVAQTQAGTSTTVAVTPASLKGAVGFSNLFTSTAQTITSAGALTIAHGLPNAPANVALRLNCTTAELGFNAGDVLWHRHGITDTNVSRGVNVRADATNLYIRFGSFENAFAILNDTTGVASSLTNANWTITFLALG